MTWILTWSGKRFDLFEPTPEMIDPRDIAQALGTIARFNGHTKEHYTVAQHSVIVANLVPPEHQLAALLHDATEAYIGDMVRPPQGAHAGVLRGGEAHLVGHLCSLRYRRRAACLRQAGRPGGTCH